MTAPTRFTEAMVEIVARAIFDAEQECLGQEFQHPERQFKVAIVQYRMQARAAMSAHLTALTDSGSVILPREATEEMSKAAAESKGWELVDGEANLYPDVIYRAMRDAALGA